MAVAMVVDALCDGEAHPRLSFERFRKRIKVYVEKLGREDLLLTHASSPNDTDEAIDVEELDRPKSGVYRARLRGGTQRIESFYTSAMDVGPKDPRYSIDTAYQAQIETSTVRLAMLSQEVIDMQARLKLERDLRFAAEDDLRVVKRRVEELEAELDADDEPLLDDSLISLGRQLFGDAFNFQEAEEAAKQALDAIENDPHVSAFLVAKCPRVLLLLAKAAGEAEPDADEPAEEAT